jgi:dTMP kinase
MLHTETGLFVVFEGIDGSGEDTQLDILYKKIKKWDKYQDVSATHEPWRNKEIKRKLETDKDAYSDAEEMTELYIGDRTDHTYIRILPNLAHEGIVLCSRYKMSTCAFQQAQGIPLDRLLKMHGHRGIIRPDITFFLDVEREVAAKRIKSREKQEKFERDSEFIDRVIANYRSLYELSKTDIDLFGRVIKIDGNPDIDTVAGSIEKVFLPFYREWKGLDFHPSDFIRSYQIWQQSQRHQ